MCPHGLVDKKKKHKCTATILLEESTGDENNDNRHRLTRKIGNKCTVKPKEALGR